MKKILVIDDDILVLRTMSKLLSIKGFLPREARHGEEAVRLLMEEEFDLIISDIKMAGVNGIQVVERLRNMGKNTPVILITGYASEDAPVEAYRLGVNDYILKPFDKDDFLKKVEKNLLAAEKKEDSFKGAFKELRQLIERFEKENSFRIYEDEKLKFFLAKLNSIVFAIEKNQTKINA